MRARKLAIALLSCSMGAFGGNVLYNNLNLVAYPLDGSDLSLGGLLVGADPSTPANSNCSDQTGTNCPVFQFVTAVGFTPTATGQLGQISVPYQNFGQNPQFPVPANVTLTISLYAGAFSLPTTLLESWTVPGPFATDSDSTTHAPLVVVTSLLNPLLSTTRQYFVVLGVSPAHQVQGNWEPDGVSLFFEPGAYMILPADCSLPNLSVTGCGTWRGIGYGNVSPGLLVTDNTPNPQPSIASLTPNSAIAGSAAFLLTVKGSQMVPGATIQWNGLDLPTTFVSTTQVTASVTANLISNAGAAVITVANPAAAASKTLTFTITPAPGPSFIGSMPHIAAEENWTTTFTLVNKGTASAQAQLSFFGDSNDPGGDGPLTLPIAFPQQSSTAGTLSSASPGQTIAPTASWIAQTAGQPAPPVLVGSAQLSATGPVDGFAIFHQNQTAQEAVVPMETRNASSYVLPFDNTGGVVLGVAVAAQQAGDVGILLRDDSGTTIGSDSLAMSADQHKSFVLSTQYPVTAGLRGTIEFDTPASGQISVLGLRFTPPNSALTTIPPLANVATGGGSVAHLASGGDGWQTTFVLVNTGASTAQFTLNFFADQTGAPLALPLVFPQPNGGAPTAASSITRNLAAGATLLIVSSGASNLLTGSAQLSTTGHLGGFVIFRHNDQEAVVPLESRNANAYIIAFDNTNDAATGVALNSVSAQAVNIPVIVRDANGAQIATDILSLAANGHSAFTLVTGKYPETANIRGTIEFSKPAGAQIGALGIRIPPTQTYTTIPALAK